MKPVLLEGCPYGILRKFPDFGLTAYDLFPPPRRFWADDPAAYPGARHAVDAARVREIPSPAEMLGKEPGEGGWLACSRRSQNRLRAYFLVSEDPQRRLDSRQVVTLSHQVSLVKHVLSTPSLRRVLIADEVGLGKTVEAGLIIKELLEQQANLRVLYLSPARLVNNVAREMRRLELEFRLWTAQGSDARMSDRLVIASIHRAAHGENLERFVSEASCDVLIVDECHHLSAWSTSGGDSRRKYRLVRDLIAKMETKARVIFMSGTPHQGHQERFENLVGLLKAQDEKSEALSGRVIFRTKDDVRDWNGNPLFPRREVNIPVVVDLGDNYRCWIQHIHDFFRNAGSIDSEPKRRAAGWRCAQALQWAASSPQAGLGFLVRQAIRTGWDTDCAIFRRAIEHLRPYRNGSPSEPANKLLARIRLEIGQQETEADLDDVEDIDEEGGTRAADSTRLRSLLEEGISIVEADPDGKWRTLSREILDHHPGEKVVLFAQPIETVVALANYLQRTYGGPPARIIGGQTDSEREQQIREFWKAEGPRFMVSSKAGSEGINLHCASWVVHIDVPWNPMDLEQRIGRVHRFGSHHPIRVDMLVVKDSREAAAYRVAREKLRLVATTLVDSTRFESLFSRVMSLIPPEELQEVLITSPLTPFTDIDQSQLAAMVRRGFDTWQQFHDRFSAQQKCIRELDPGLASWSDLERALLDWSAAKEVGGYHATRFKVTDVTIQPMKQEVRVLELKDGGHYACGDYDGALLVGRDDRPLPRLGLNTPTVANLLRTHAFHGEAIGAAHLRWPNVLAWPRSLPTKPLGCLVLARQRVQMESHGPITEKGLEMMIFVVNSEGSTQKLEGDIRRELLDGLMQASCRQKPDVDSESISTRLLEAETRLLIDLRVPTPEELRDQIRYVVRPLLAAILG